ncbi:Leu5p [Sugiyamaella lignohabitans]|uniref:Leu5p n=1 Tax=Sugiyamaella lignohabitans TaxID=796027 RepID=A0A167F7H8_9ASCO|nr:Leu5p [Sugiyamaella lignohabitans]ANB14908.1 Leu5p [Sugiyamaella lignohabitans]
MSTSSRTIPLGGRHAHHETARIEEYNDDDVAVATSNTHRPKLNHKKTKREDKQSLDYVVKSGIAGGLAGSAAKTLIAPLDRVKILFQTSNPEFRKYTGSWTGFYKAGKHIVVSEGPLGLFRGHSATLLRIFPYAGIKFIAYEQVRGILIPSSEYETSLRRLLSGSLSGVASVFCTYPLDLIRVRLAYDHTGAVKAARQASKTAVNTAAVSTKSSSKLASNMASAAASAAASSSGSTGTTSSPSPSPTTTASSLSSANNPTKRSPGRLASIITTIYNEPSHASLKIANFYRGFTPTVLGMIPYAGVSFWAHDSFHDIFRSKLLRSIAVDYSMPESEHLNATTSRRPLKAWAQLTAGGLSGLFAQTASYPLEVVRRRMQVSGAVGNHERQHIISTAKLIIRERGIRGLFVGLTIGYMKVVPMFACSFFVYERAKMLLGI